MNKEALNYALRLLDRRDYTKKQLEDKLNSRGVSKRDIIEVVNYLKEKGYVDDERYARNYVYFRLKRGYGKKRIRFELLNKGIDEAIIDKALGLQDEKADEVFLKKYELLRGKKNLKKKLFDYMQRRGFDSQTIFGLFEKYDVRERIDENG
ncbi:regulatory protein RecX [Hippea jasoniae]|uniref:regulatory protein RecX n=1 Tax=Hippea jasoniae TaxID=944479 RepID=UPI00068A4E14|nr:regulatory protein RecX [Hippea jasoniae]